MYQQTSMTLAMFKQIYRKELSNCQGDIGLYRHRLNIINAVLAKVQSGKSEITNNIYVLVKQYLNEACERHRQVSSLYFQIVGFKASSSNQEVMDAFGLTDTGAKFETYIELDEEHLLKSGKILTEFISLANVYLSKVTPPNIGDK